MAVEGMRTEACPCRSPMHVLVPDGSLDERAAGARVAAITARSAAPLVLSRAGDAVAARPWVHGLIGTAVRLRILEACTCGGFVRAFGVAKVHMALMRLWASRPKRRASFFQAARGRSECGLLAFASALHVSPPGAPTRPLPCAGRTSPWGKTLQRERRVPHGHVPRHGGRSRAALGVRRARKKPAYRDSWLAGLPHAGKPMAIEEPLSTSSATPSKIQVLGLGNQDYHRRALC